MAPLRYTARMNESRLQQEILEQPTALQRLLDEGRASVQAAAAAIRAFDPAFVTIAARGSSDNAARYAQYLFGAQNRLPVGLATPSLYSVYASPPRLQRSLVIGISQSGQSPDIVAVLRAGREQHALTIAITNDSDSPLAQVADHCIPLHCGPERSVAATKTYTSSLLAIALLGAELAQAQERLDLLARIPQHVQALCERGTEFSAAGAAQRDMQSCVVLSPRLQLRHRLRNRAQAQGAVLRAGRALVFGGLPARARRAGGTGFRIAGHRPARPRWRPNSPRCWASCADAARVCWSFPRSRKRWRWHIRRCRCPRCRNGSRRWSRCCPGQFFALGLTQAKGLDVDQPRGLSKVTRTQ